MIKIGIIDTEIRTDQIIFDKTHFVMQIIKLLYFMERKLQTYCYH